MDILSYLMGYKAGESAGGGSGGGASETVILPETEYNGFAQSEFGYMVQVAPPPFSLVVGETYLVKWDDTEFTCKAQDVSGTFGEGSAAIGNLAAFGIGTGNSEPFVIGSNATYVGFFAMTDSSTSHKVSIYQQGEASGGSSADVRYVTFMSDDGTAEFGKLPVATGYDCPNPKFAVTKESTAQYHYDLAGWATTPNGAMDANALKEVNEDRTVYANFAAILRSYTMTYLDTDGSVLKTETLPYGSMPNYEPEKDGFGFEGWNPAIDTVTGDATYTAVWAEKLTFANASWADIAEIVNAGEAQKYFKVGDTKEISNTNRGNITVAIAGFDHDDLENGSGKASMSIIAMSCFDYSKEWCSNASNYYPMYDRATFPQTYLNNDVWYFLPVALRNIIKKVKKDYDYTYSSGTSPEVRTIAQNLWLPSLTELGDPSATSTNLTALGHKYELFNTATQSGGYYIFQTATIADTGTKCRYYTRSMHRAGTFNPYYVDTDGKGKRMDNQKIPSENLYIRFGFCI